MVELLALHHPGDDKVSLAEFWFAMPITRRKLAKTTMGRFWSGQDFLQDLEVEISVSHRDEWFITVEGEKEANLDVPKRHEDIR
jgi:hypothetical protein